MTGPAAPDPASASASVALVLAEIRRSVDVGFARVDGQLALFLQRADQTDKRITGVEDDVDELRKALEGDIDELQKELDALKAGRWPLPSIAALTGVVALAVATWQAMGN